MTTLATILAVAAATLTPAFLLSATIRGLACAIIAKICKVLLS